MMDEHTVINILSFVQYTSMSWCCEIRGVV
jgi:hypothetical protein